MANVSRVSYQFLSNRNIKRTSPEGNTICDIATGALATLSVAFHFHRVPIHTYHPFCHRPSHQRGIFRFTFTILPYFHPDLL